MQWVCWLVEPVCGAAPLRMAAGQRSAWLRSSNGHMTGHMRLARRWCTCEWHRDQTQTLARTLTSVSHGPTTLRTAGSQWQRFAQKRHSSLGAPSRCTVFSLSDPLMHTEMTRRVHRAAQRGCPECTVDLVSGHGRGCQLRAREIDELTLTR